MNTTPKTFLWVGIFAIAMAALESAVVVYLRALYYPDGFSVVFRLIDPDILKVELLREMATLVMLVAVGYIAGKNFTERLAYFLLAFAVWDIFYYGWLKILIDWPASVFEWDILFLIPFTWLGPVWAPLVCSVTMIALGVVLLASPKPVSSVVWTLLIAGSSFILYAFMVDYGKLILGNGFAAHYPNLLQNEDFLKLVSQFSPKSFSSVIFWLGEGLLTAAIYMHHRGPSVVFFKRLSSKSIS
ncbi:MAG: hypothetical protein M3Y60_05385 [Bacteroidota bacterium]|nr:hypothetical protein [Bacteroidota bacterium]